jgi:phage-related protein
MNTWLLHEFKKVVSDFLAKCDEDMKEVLERRLDTLREKGNACCFPVSESLGDNLFELRGRYRKQQARLIYYFAAGKNIIFVHAFYKKTPKISHQDMDMAKRNRKILQEGRGKAYGLYLTN